MGKKKNRQTFAKQAREIAVKERRDRKRARKAEAAAQRAAGPITDQPESLGAPTAER